MHKTLAAVLGAVVAVALALMLGVYDGEHPYLLVHDFIHHDLGVIGVIVGTSIVVAIAFAFDLFHFLVVRIVTYIVAVAISANSGALMTFASGIPTLMIGTSAQIPYVHFLLVS